MSRSRFKISMPLEGFVAGPSQRVGSPLGIGGGRLHECAFQLPVFRRLPGLEGGEVNENTAVFEESLANIGATTMGRKMFGGHRWCDNVAFSHLPRESNEVRASQCRDVEIG